VQVADEVASHEESHPAEAADLVTAVEKICKDSFDCLVKVGSLRGHEVFQKL
jgi:hypothetical protein